MTADGSIAETHLHEIRPGVSPRTVAQHRREAEEICQSCPVLEMCRTYAALSSWQGVTVAGWSAPSHTEAYPPWTPDWCVACGRDGIPLHGLICYRCRSRRRRAREERWWSYVDQDRLEDYEDPVGAIA